jgi:small basic protein
MVIAGGLVLLGLSVLLGRWTGGAGAIPDAAKYFIPIWLIAALINMWVGVTRAGYSAADEAPIFVLIFAIPAAVALFVWWRFSHV